MGGRSNIKDGAGLVSIVCNRQQRDNMFPCVRKDIYKIKIHQIYIHFLEYMPKVGIDTIFLFLFLGCVYIMY